LIDLVTEFLDSPEALLPDGSGRTYMDIMDTDAEEELEAEYWTNRLAKQAATDLLFYGRVGTGNMDAILSMHPNQQTETLSLAMNYGTQLQHIQKNIQANIDEKLKLEGKTETSYLTKPPTDELRDIVNNPRLSVDQTNNDTDEGDILGVYNPSIDNR
jgi:cyclopropane fatty-acyl-phospholipid synthase-like methyltransferase